MARSKSSKPYNPGDVEGKIYRRWERVKAFTPPTTPRRGRKPFVIVIPPPNITGSLHMGHALQDVLMDVLIRYHRMWGDDTLWVPGTDHAGIATQNVVEKELKKEGKTRHDLGREKFVERVWRWKEQYGMTITEQMRRLGCSCDWSRERFTLDPAYVRAVQEAFIHYAQKGLIYRGDRIVNWCPRCTSSISDLEVKYEERAGTFTHLTYPLMEGPGGVTIVTTRPETILGDTAVAVNPTDHRFRDIIGKRVRVPLTERDVPVIEDTAVDATFGSGALKITPAHDHLDWEIGERHTLPLINVIGEDGKMTRSAGAAYRGLSVEDARARIIRDLKDGGYFAKEPVSMKHRVALCDRCGTVIQPLVSKQWFVRMEPLAKPAVDVVKKGMIRFTPSRWEKTCLDWLRGVKDWCVSRQLWWGHRIPVWYCTKDREHWVAALKVPKACGECGCPTFEQDPDVLDTWFSSALWPFAVFGWPEATADLTRFYPTSVLTTAQEILQLWVARMVFSGLEFMNRKTYLPARQYGKTNVARHVPFRDVIIHQTVLNLKGQRMSKSRGTGVDPMDLIEQYGADATRFGLLIQTQRDQQAMRFDEHAVRTGRNVVNKLWNIARYLKKGAGRTRSGGSTRRPPTPFDAWILSRCAGVTREVSAALPTYRFGDAMRALHAFLWDDFADWYIEASKVPGMTTPGVAREVFTTLLRLLHPFLPFVTEELWVSAGGKKLLLQAPWPAEPERTTRAGAIAHVRKVQQVVRAIRSARALLGIPASKKLRVQVGGSSIYHSLFPAIAFLSGSGSVTMEEGDDGWIPVPTGIRLRLRLHRDALMGLDIRGRLADAEKRVIDLQNRIRTSERRLTVMRPGAPADAIAEAEASLAAGKQDLAEREHSVAVLRVFLGKTQP